MGNQSKKFDTQEILNQSSDQDVAPVLLQVGQKVWNGSGWDKAGPGGMSGESAVKYAKIDAATSGDNTLVSAVAGKKIRVLSLFYVASGTVNIRFESDASGTALTGQMNHVANTGASLPFNQGGWFETTAGELLNLELSGAVSVDGSLSYVEV